MRANISEELMDMIHERIMLDLEIQILEKKLSESVSKGYSQYLDNLILTVGKHRQKVNSELHKQGVKIFDRVEDDDKEFVEYPYHVRVNGGYKQGTMRYWRHAIRMHLNKRMSKYKGGL